MKKQTISTEQIILATIDYIAEYGLENVTTKKVANSISISEGTIFNNFASKKELLSACLSYIDTQIDSVLQQVPSSGLNLKKYFSQMWHAYFLYLVDHGNFAKFYLRFRHSSYYTDEVMKGQDFSYSFFSVLLRKDMRFFGIHPDIFWVYLVETTLNFAVRIVDDKIPHTKKDIDKIYSLISHGFYGVFKK